jgi:hypothetical protein
MKKTILGILIFFVLIIMGFFIWCNLPLSINRRSDIKLGNQIIENIERYQNQNGLPNNTDRETLQKFGFRDKIDCLQPEYRKLNENEFELVYLEGFDGPYLMWTSKERTWKIGYPTFDKTTTK